MIASWMAYSVLVSVGIYFAAHTLERGLRALYRPARFVWVGALFLALVAGASAMSRWRTADFRTWAPAATQGAGHSRTLPAVLKPNRTVVVPPASVVNRLDQALVGTWLVGSLLTLAVFGCAARGLRRITSRARITEVAGAKVALTPATGPFVVGLLKPRIVVPQWVLALDPTQQELVIAHEESHVASRDPRLLAFAALSVVIAPWNPLLWYMLRRLRHAVEIDCDQRVLERHPDVRCYADLLLAVASRNQVNVIAAVGLAASAASLEQRFALMSKKRLSRPYRIVASIGVALVALLATAMIPQPVPQRSAMLGFQGSGGNRATGRVRVSGAEDFAQYRAVSTGGALSQLGQPFGPRTIPAMHSAEFAGSNVFDIDVTEGTVEFESKDTTSLHVEASMGGVSPTAWLSATGHHLIIEKGGTGIRVVPMAR